MQHVNDMYLVEEKGEFKCLTLGGSGYYNLLMTVHYYYCFCYFHFLTLSIFKNKSLDQLRFRRCNEHYRRGKLKTYY